MPTLNWLISNSGLKNIKLVSPPQKKDSPITSVNVLDNPDVIKWFKRDELILTTGFVFKEHPELIRSSIQELKHAGCCALGIKVPRFFRTVPEELLTIASQYDFPILELPYFYSFSEIMQCIFHQIDTETFSSQHERQLILDQLLHAVLSHIPLSELLAVTAKQLNTPAAFFDGSGKVLACGLPSGDSLDIAHFLETIAQCSSSCQRGNVIRFQDRDYQLEAYELPNECGQLCLAYSPQEHTAPDKDFMQSIVQFFALSYEQNHISERSYENRSSGFLHYLLYHNHSRPTQLRDLCTFYGFPYQKGWICLTIATRQLPAKHKSETLLILRSLLEDFTTRDLPIIPYADENIFCSFFVFPTDCPPMTALNAVQQISKEMASRLKHVTSASLPTGFSTFHKTLLGIQRAFDESIQAIALQEYFPKDAPTSYLSLLPLQMMTTVPNQDRQLLIQNLLQPIIDYDQESHASLQATLIKYLNNKGNISTTAKDLFLHRNTMIHRINKIKELLQLQLEDSQEILLLQLALISHQLEQLHGASNIRHKSELSTFPPGHPRRQLFPQNPSTPEDYD